MNERYAVDPAAPADARELKLLLDQFGLQTGRFLSRYPQDWPWRLLARFEGMSDMERKRGLELFRKRSHCMQPAPAAPYVAETSWENNAAIAAQRHRAFNGVIGQRGNSYGWPSVEHVLYEDGHGLPPGQGAHVPMKALTYAECVRPLMKASAEVILVDPYFTSRNKFGQRCSRRWPVLVALLKEAEDSDICESFRLVLDRAQIAETARTVNVLQSDLADALAECGARRVKPSCEVRDSVGHGRYLLSIHGGLQFDQGFEEKSRAENHVHWLSEPELRPLLTKFSPPTALVRR